MPRQQRAELTREEVLLAAGEVFDRNGYVGSTMNDIVALTGKTKGAVYFHFPSKQELAVAVINRQYEAWPPLVDEVAARGLSPLATLIELTYEVARRFRDDVFVRAGVRLAAERDMLDAPLPGPYVGWTEIVHGLLERAAAAEELAPGVDAKAAARVLVSAFFGLQHLSAVMAGRRDIEERLTELWGMLLPGLRGTAKG